METHPDIIFIRQPRAELKCRSRISDGVARLQIGESVRLRDGTFTNGTVRGILGNEVRVAWDNIAGDPQWYHQDFILKENRPVERGRPAERPAETDIVDQACRLVAIMDDDQRRRFIVRMQETYK